METGKNPLIYDAAAFPAFEFGHIIPPKINSSLVPNLDIFECLNSAVYLASQIELAEGSVHLRAEKIRNIYFRASLSELLRVEDLTKGLGKPFELKKTRDPLLHTIKLLRNYQVHIGTFTLRGGRTPVNWNGDISIYESFIADNLLVKELRKLGSSKGYTDSQLEELLGLFDLHQQRFGVVQLLYNTCLHVGRLISEHHLA